MDETSFNAGFGSPKYKKFSFGGGFGFNKYSPYSSWDSDGRNNKSKRFNINYFPNDQLQFSFGVDDSKEEEWLKWIDTNRLGSFTKKRRNINFGMTFFQGTRHEFRLKNQSVMIKAEDPTPLISSLSGELSESDYLIDPFYVSENSLQMRYRYEISPLSYFYLVYTRGYSFYDDTDTFTYEDLYQDSWENPSNEVFTLKVRFKF
tara:strand:- start:671 stop:1282 length:612 start_codon:yes stop_codon:yes gene_type:complete